MKKLTHQQWNEINGKMPISTINGESIKLARWIYSNLIGSQPPICWKCPDSVRDAVRNVNSWWEQNRYDYRPGGALKNVNNNS